MAQGMLPFDDSAEQLSLYEQIKLGLYSFPDNNWGDVSESAKDLCRRLLQVEPAVRWTAKQALAHPWCKVRFYQREATRAERCERVTMLPPPPQNCPFTRTPFPVPDELEIQVKEKRVVKRKATLKVFALVLFGTNTHVFCTTGNGDHRHRNVGRPGRLHAQRYNRLHRSELRNLWRRDSRGSSTAYAQAPLQLQGGQESEEPLRNGWQETRPARAKIDSCSLGVRTPPSEL